MKTEVEVSKLQSAVEEHERATRLCRKIADARGEFIPDLRDLKTLAPPGIYEHWKSADGAAKFYVVFGVGIELDKYTPLVSHAALYPPYQGITSFRHLIDKESGFLTPIDREEYQGPRFKLIYPLAPWQLVTVIQYVWQLCLIKSPTLFRISLGKILKRTPFFL